MRAAVSIIAIAFLATPAVAGDFRICTHNRPEKQACVIDGDTFWFRGEKIRPIGFDAPEAKGQYCDTAGPIYERAGLQLLELLNTGGFQIEPTGLDQYGRTLARVTVDGRISPN